jgi:hypothetical protein
MRSLEGTGPVRALRLGLLRSAASPKTASLAAAGGLAIGAAGLTIAGTALGLAVFSAIAKATVALPLLLHALPGARILTALGGARGWLTVHGHGRRHLGGRDPAHRPGRRRALARMTGAEAAAPVKEPVGPRDCRTADAKRPGLTAVSGDPGPCRRPESRHLARTRWWDLGEMRNRR